VNRPMSRVTRLLRDLVGGMREGTASAIYGTIVTTAVIVTLSEDPGASSGELMEAVAATSAVFCLAHAYSEFLGEFAGRTDRTRLRSFGAIVGRELPIVESAVVPLAALALGAFGVLGRNHAVTLALVVALLELLTWGYLAGRRMGVRLPGAVTIGLVNCAFGAAIVFLKALIH
jgi:hypothetical protein